MSLKRTFYRSKQHSKIYRTIALAGGGVRGYMQAKIILYLDQAYSILDHVDLICGTSIGGVNALALSIGVTPEELVLAYPGVMKKLFKRTLGRRIIGFGSGLLFPKYSIRDKIKMLAELIPETELSFDNVESRKVIKQKLLDELIGIPFTLNRRMHTALCYHDLYKGPILVSSFENSNISLTKAVEKTSAAPGFWKSDDSKFDGGISANNPMALLKILENRLENMDSFPTRYNQIVKKTRFRCLGIGTGKSIDEKQYDSLIKGNQGQIYWVNKLTDIFMESSQRKVTEDLLVAFDNAEDYRIIEFKTPGYIPLDNLNKYELMDEIVETFIKNNKKLLRDYAHWFMKE